ncbi:MAG: retroviral-like aspartic protease family protein [Methanophagales archaeon]|jgi:hypothetical protein|nr:retroviral-like aspartic protease family protein [Methanophagales archaeon]
MCLGYFKGGRPKVDAILYSQNFKKPKSINFLVDTGADITTITLADALKLGIDVHRVIAPNRRRDVEGVGGTTDVYPIEGTIGLTFLDYSSETDKISFHIEFLERINLVPKLSMSILGRDLLDRFDIEISRVSERINLKRNDFGGGGHLCFSRPIG